MELTLWAGLGLKLAPSLRPVGKPILDTGLGPPPFLGLDLSTRFQPLGPSLRASALRTTKP